MIRRKILEDMGIDVPEDAARFHTKDAVIFFMVPVIEEYGTSIVFREEIIEMDLTEEQLASLDAANCLGETGQTIV